MFPASLIQFKIEQKFTLTSSKSILVSTNWALGFRSVEIAFENEEVHLEILLRHDNSVVNKYLLDLVNVLSLNHRVFDKQD